MVRQSPRLLKDVNDAEEAELRRLEGRVDDVPVADGTGDSGGDSGGGGTTQVVQVSGGRSKKTGFALADKEERKRNGVAAFRSGEPWLATPRSALLHRRDSWLCRLPLRRAVA